MLLRSVGYQSIPLAGVPFDDRSHTVPNAEGGVLGPEGEPMPGEYAAGWLKCGPTGVIGTNKSDAALTVRSLLADLADGPGPGDAQLPRPGLLRLPAPGDEGAAGDSPWSARFAELLAARGVRPISYADWLKIETAEMLLIRSAHQPRLERICEGVADLPVPRQSVPPPGAFLEQTVRAWHTAGHSQRAIARELSIDRRKAPRAHEAERRPATAPQMA